MYDTQNEIPIEMNWDEINKANRDEPNRYLPAAQALPIMMKQATMREIQTASKTVRNDLNALKGDFTAIQRAQFAKVLASDNVGGAWSNFIVSSVGKTLSSEQMRYMRSIKNLIESSFALRQLYGGQTSDKMRGAIEGAIPGGATFSKAEANYSLDLFDTQLNILRTGVSGKDITSTPQGNIAPLGGANAPPASVMTEKEARDALKAKGIEGKDQDTWINTYKKAGKVK
jgi:hypothetical protein